MRQGDSWSGHERNCAFLNLGGDTPLANVSHVTGVDFADDARGLAATDWDQDGDLDLWITNRTEPAVRFLRNNTSGNWLAVRLKGVDCNRDAIGARVELRLRPSGIVLLRTLRAGDAFL
ncbi:MAG: hypothetical protein KDA41_17440, partial [Planctomycetales bacterium]|nr:hypothetical protein [Planctomycetales bacterium]